MSRYRGLIVLLMDVALIFCCNFVIFLSDLFVENVQLFNLLMHIGLLTVCVLVFQLTPSGAMLRAASICRCWAA